MMADFDRDDDTQDDVLDLAEGDRVDDAAGDDDTAAPEDADDEQDVVFEIDGEAVDADTVPDSGLVKHLRQQLKDRDQRLKQYERPQQPVEVGPKPTLADCDYDEDAYEQQMDAWRARRDEAAKGDRQRQEAEEANRKRFEGEVAAYEAKKQALGFADVPQAEAAAAEALNDWQRNAVIRYADDPAKVMYALGKSSAKRDHFSGIGDVLDFVKAMVKLEGSINVSKRPKPPAPEQIARGTGRAPGVDKELARLEKEAERTGDRTALIRYRRTKG